MESSIATNDIDVEPPGIKGQVWRLQVQHIGTLDDPEMTKNQQKQLHLQFSSAKLNIYLGSIIVVAAMLIFCIPFIISVGMLLFGEVGLAVMMLIAAAALFIPFVITLAIGVAASKMGEAGIRKAGKWKADTIALNRRIRKESLSIDSIDKIKRED